MKSLSVDALTITSRWPIMRAASSRSLVSNCSGFGRVHQGGEQRIAGQRLASNWSSLASSVPLKRAHSVTLPPGRLNPSTSPNLTGSPPSVRQSGLSWWQLWPARRGKPAHGSDHRDLTTNEIGRQRWQRDRIDCRPSGTRFDVSCPRHGPHPSGPGGMHRSDTQRAHATLSKKADHHRCARATTGHAAVPASPAMNSRLIIRSPRPREQAAPRGLGCRALRPSVC